MRRTNRYEERSIQTIGTKFLLKSQITCTCTYKVAKRSLFLAKSSRAENFVVTTIGQDCTKPPFILDVSGTFYCMVLSQL